MTAPVAPQGTIAVVLEGALLKRFVDLATGDGPQLTTVELIELSAVTRIGRDFFHYGKNLTRLDLSPLCNITNVSHNFLNGCTGLREIDLSPLRNVTSVEDNFLAHCTGFTQIDVSPLHNVARIGQAFLAACRGITALDLSPLRNATSVGNYFLAWCDGLTQLASTPLATRLGWSSTDRDELAQLLVTSNKQRVVNLCVSWDARLTALRIRNFAPSDHANHALRIWSVMRGVVRFLSPARVPDTVMIAEEQRLLEVASDPRRTENSTDGAADRRKLARVGAKKRTRNKEGITTRTNVDGSGESAQ